MACSLKSVKYGLFISILLFLACQILMAVYTAYILHKTAGIDGFLVNSSLTEKIWMHSLALLIFISTIVLLGSCAIIRENFCCTVMFAVITGISFVLRTAGVIFIWFNLPMLRHANDGLIEDFWHQHANQQDVIDKVQLNLQCCGLYSRYDYDVLPNSCCNTEELQHFSTCNPYIAFEHSCSGEVPSLWGRFLESTCHINTGTAVVELISLIFACCLANQIRIKNKLAKQIINKI